MRPITALVWAALFLGWVTSCGIPVEQSIPDEYPVASNGPPVEIVEFNSRGELLGSIQVPRIVKNDAAWRLVLADAAFNVARRKGTELAFSGRYNDFHGVGIYRCGGCGTALFSSADKFDSKTGWPSFTAPAARENVYSQWDESWGARRREVLCRRCDAHLGHVFKDGPRPTYLRYCVNSAALRFDPIVGSGEGPSPIAVGH